MRKLFLLFPLLCALLWGCGQNTSTADIEFFTLTDDVWTPVTSPSVTDPPETEATPDPSAEDVICTYVLNRSSKKFHDPACSSVGKIKAENRESFSGTRDKLVSQGYEPCKICNP